MTAKKTRRIITGLLACLLFLTCFAGTAKADWNVTPSTTNYKVEMDGAYCMFLYNEKSIGSKVGTEYYLTYTVESMKIEKHSQQGIIGTNVPESFYPYQDDGKGGGGFYRFAAGENALLVEGNTYFIKFTITKDGYDYRVAWGKASDGTSAYVKLKNTYGSVKTNLGYFGLFLADVGMTGTLKKVRFYDKNGTDLGVGLTVRDNKAVVGREDPWPKNTSMQHSYSIVVDNQPYIGISNLRVATGSKVYMEYKVKSIDNAYLYTRGVAIANSPKRPYPYEGGLLIYEQYEMDKTKVDEGPLLTVGAEYLLIFEKKDGKPNVIIQKTYKGETTYISFGGRHGTYYEDSNFYTIWLLGVENFGFVLEDFKCYDSDGNNLGVQCNQTVEIIHYGEHEDYAICDGYYYNEKDGSYYVLSEDKTLMYYKGGKELKGTYKIVNSVLHAKTAEGTIKYDFMYGFFTDEAGNKYERLRKYKIIFETGKGSAVDMIDIDKEDKYKVVRPEDPTLKGNQFLGWYTLEGEEYDFEQLVTESVTLYAKWSAMEEYTPIANGPTVSASKVPYVIFGIGTAVLFLAVALTIVAIAKGGKHGSIREK